MNDEKPLTKAEQAEVDEWSRTAQMWHPEKDALASAVPEFDDKGRPEVIYMTNRDLLEEAVRSQRAVADMVEKFIASMEKNPMMKMMAGRFGG